MTHLVSTSTALAFLTNVSEEHKSALPSAIQVKNWQMTIFIEEKLDIVSRLEKGEQIVDRWCNVRFADSDIHTICDNADKFTESAKSGHKVFM